MLRRDLSLAFLSLTFLAGLGLPTPSLGAAPTTPRQLLATPRFDATPAEREERIRPLLGEVDRYYLKLAEEKHLPGLVWGVVLDGRLIHTGTRGTANLEQKIPVHLDTRFRIASMTKSFTAMAVLRLRDAEKLSLDDAVATHVPDFAAVGTPTADSPPVTVRHLLNMTAGFPEDNPWGDRQLAITPEALRAFLRQGVAWSQVPGVAYEYSNLAFALLGAVISRTAGQPYQRYITDQILTPLGMKDTTWDHAGIPPEKLALGYRWRNGAWQAEPILHDGAYGAMGGLWTTLPDFARYVSLHLSAWPPRDEPDAGPVPRATLREMHRMDGLSALNSSAKSWNGAANPTVTGYHCGLRWSLDSMGIRALAHGGGLPGYGSHYSFYPDHGLAVIAFANLTYAGPATGPIATQLIEQAPLRSRVLPVSAILAQRQQEVLELLKAWDEQQSAALLGENFFLDRSRSDWVQHSREMLERIGRITSVEPIVPENQLRGTFALVGEKGRLNVYFNLTPEHPPKIQLITLTFVPPR